MAQASTSSLVRTDPGSSTSATPTPSVVPSASPTTAPTPTAAPIDAPTATPVATPTAGPTTAPTASPTATPAATWKGVVLVYRETDVTFTRADGTDYRLQARMGNAMHDLVLDTVDRYRRSVRSWSGGLAAIQLDVVDVPHPITELDSLGSGYWVGPHALEADIDQYAPTGSYDSIFVVWQSKDAAGEIIPVGGWGLTLPPGSWANNAGYSSVITPSEMWWWTNSSAPEEVFIHEWMHQVVYWNEQSSGFDFDLHAGRSYGYDDADGTWKRWLSDVMQGRVREGANYVGVNAEMWAAGSPRGK